ncbi:MAG: chemotaxis protein CheW [Acidobacteriota bacterium]
MKAERRSRFLALRVGGAVAALPLHLVREVVASSEVVPVPGSLPHVAGVALHRGAALPVYDLRRFEPVWPGAAPAPPEAAPQLIVCVLGEALVGLLGDGVDLLEGGRRAEPGREDGDTDLRREYLIGLVMSGDRGIALLDAARLFTSMGVPVDGGRGAREGDGEEDPAGR